MPEINYNSIFNGVSRALHQRFPSAQVHGNTVKQDMCCGDFIVLPLTTQHSGQMGTRSKRSVTFDVIYLATENGGREDCLRISDILPTILAMITTDQGDIIHGSGFDSEIEDDVLHCIVNYPCFVYTPSKQDEMESLKYLQEV